MDFKYKEKTYNSKTILNNILFVIDVVKNNNHSGLLANEILTSYLSRKKHDIPKSTLNDSINRLKELDIIRTTSKGKKVRKRDSNNEYNFYCSKHYIDKQRLLFTYALCTFLENNNNHKLSCKAYRNKLVISLDKLFDDTFGYYSKNNEWYNNLFFYKDFNNNSLKRSLSWNTKFHNVLLVYYYLFIYSSLTNYQETQYRITYNEYLNFFTYNYFLPISEELISLWNTFFNKDGSPRNIVRDQPNSFPEFIGSPNIWSGYNLTLPEIPSIIWFTDDKVEKEKVFDLKDIDLKDGIPYQTKFVNQIVEEFNFKKYKPINIYSSYELSEREENQLCDDFAWYISSNSSVLKQAKEYLDIINNRQARKISLKLHVEIKQGYSKKKGWRYTLSVSGRHYSQIASAPAEARNDIDRIEYKEYDLHSAAFNIAKMLNGREYKVKDDIKEDILGKNYKDLDGRELIKDGIKPLLYRCCFSPSIAFARAKYERLLNFSSDKVKKKKRYISVETFEELYNYCQEWTGGTEKFRNALFFSESLFELCVYSNIVLKSPFSKKENVYDCFYYDGTVFKESDIDKLCLDAVKIVSDCYNEEKLSGKEEKLKYYKLW